MKIVAKFKKLTDLIICFSDVKKDSTVILDSFGFYSALEKNCKHKIINHSLGHFSQGSIYINTIEDCWSLLKGGIIGIYHKAGSRRLHRYCARSLAIVTICGKVKTKWRDLINALQNCEGRLMDKTLIGKTSH